MEVKKSEKANLENRKLFYRELGLIIALVIILAAFEWSTEEKAESVIQEETAVIVEVEEIPVTTEAPPPPPEAPKVPQLSDMIEVVRSWTMISSWIQTCLSALRTMRTWVYRSWTT